MPAKERFAAILPILQKQRTIMVLGLTQALSISESTIRRDPVALYKMGGLKKVHGGTTLLHKRHGLYETEMVMRSEGHVEGRKRTACYAALLIQVHDFVYIDAGGATPYMMEYPKEEEAIYVTNGLEHGRRLATQGFRTFLLAGELRSKTETVVSFGAVSSLQKYNFNKAFLGTNDITMDSGFTTPDTNEAYVKMEVIEHAQRYYALVDPGKFGTCTFITTADISDAAIITNKGVEKEYLEEADIVKIEE